MMHTQTHAWLTAAAALSTALQTAVVTSNGTLTPLTFTSPAVVLSSLKCARIPENLLRTEAPNMESSFVLGTSQPLGVYHVVNEIVELRHLSVHGYPAKE
jgi:hypothetical protein